MKQQNQNQIQKKTHVDSGVSDGSATTSTISTVRVDSGK